jgi:hypothetical protein
MWSASWPPVKLPVPLSATSGNMVVFHSFHSATSRFRSLRFGRSIGSATTLKRKVLSRIFRYLKSPSHAARYKLRRRLLARRRLAWGMLRNMGRRPSVRTALPRGARRTPAILYGHRETDWRFESRAGARAVRPVAGLRINNGGSRWSPPSSYRMSSGPARSGSKLPSSRKAPSSLSWVFASV